MPHPVFRFVRALAALCALAGCAAAPRTAPALVPDPQRAEGLALDEGGTWRADVEGFLLELERLSGPERLRFLREATGFEVDPFAVPPGAPERFATFRLALDNRGSAPLSFEPRGAWLVSADAVRSATGLDDLRAGYGILGGELPAAYERVRPALLESSVTLAPGASAEGLLVFPQALDGLRRYRVELNLLVGDGSVARFVAPYRRPGRSAR